MLSNTHHNHTDVLILACCSCSGPNTDILAVHYGDIVNPGEADLEQIDSVSGNVFIETVGDAKVYRNIDSE